MLGRKITLKLVCYRKTKRKKKSLFSLGAGWGMDVAIAGYNFSQQVILFPTYGKEFVNIYLAGLEVSWLLLGMID